MNIEEKNMVNIIIIGAVLLILCIVFFGLAVSLSNDRKMMKLYKQAELCTGIIIKQRED